MSEIELVICFLAEALKGSKELPSTLCLPAWISVVTMPRLSSAYEMSMCMATTPIEPTLA